MEAKDTVMSWDDATKDRELTTGDIFHCEQTATIGLVESDKDARKEYEAHYKMMLDLMQRYKAVEAQAEISFKAGQASGNDIELTRDAFNRGYKKGKEAGTKKVVDKVKPSKAKTKPTTETVSNQTEEKVKPATDEQVLILKELVAKGHNLKAKVEEYGWGDIKAFKQLTELQAERLIKEFA